MEYVISFIVALGILYFIQTKVCRENWIIVVGALLSVIVIYVTGVLAYVTIPNLDPPIRINELGDYIAGIGGVLVLIWLVVGVFQNQKDLRLQMKAMAISSEAHEKMEETMREEFETRLKNDRNARSICLNFGNYTQRGGPSAMELRLINLINNIHDLHVWVPGSNESDDGVKVSKYSGKVFPDHSISNLLVNQVFSIHIVGKCPREQFNFKISYRDAVGEFNSICYSAGPDELAVIPEQVLDSRPNKNVERVFLRKGEVVKSPYSR